VLLYLQVTQNADGGWPQNMWLDGTGYWDGIQMDETALPILLVDLARREQALTQADLTQLWPMVRRAASYLVRNGPVTQQDRWEEDPGYAPFTLAVEIAALLVAADLAEVQGEAALAAYLRETADAWNDSIERWTYVTNTELANRFGVEGYYVRIGAVDVAEAAPPTSGYVPIKNRPPEQSIQLASRIVSPDALALVRFGLRAPDDPRILNTIKVIDGLLKTETPAGAIWHRYNGDGYGEHEDGSPFDGTGIGRGWPLLTGERGHYEVAAGHCQSAEKLLHTLEGLAGESGLLPEQIWDAPDIVDRKLWFGKPSGSAMPLVWAHAENVKLVRSLRDGRVFDMPPQPVERYIKSKANSPYTLWRFNNKCATMPTGRELRIEVPSPALIHWSADGWKSTQDAETEDTGLGVYVADLPTAAFTAGVTLLFTLFWPDEGRWEGQDYRVVVED
jgi:glucoamylase